MKIITIINFFTTIFGFVITILTGLLLIRHRQFIYYFKDAFGFIKEDFTPDLDIEYGNFFKESFLAIKFGFKALKKSNSSDVYHLDHKNEINQILVLLGKLIVLSGVLGIITTLISSLWMLFSF